MFSRGSYTVKKLVPHNKAHEPITISLFVYISFKNCNKLDLQPNNYRFLMFIFLEYQKQKEEYGDCLKEGLKRLISLKKRWEKVEKITKERSPFYASGWGQFNLMVDGY